MNIFDQAKREAQIKMFMTLNSSAYAQYVILNSDGHIWQKKQQTFITKKTTDNN